MDSQLAAYNILNSIKAPKKQTKFPYSALSDEKLLATRKVVEVLAIEKSENDKSKIGGGSAETGIEATSAAETSAAETGAAAIIIF